MAERAVRYRQPSLALRPFITTYYWVDVPGGGPPVTDWLHPEWPNVRFLLDGGWRSDVGSGMVEVPACALFGPTRRAAKVVGDSPSRLVGLGLLPLGFATLFDLEAASLSHRLGPLEDHMPCVRGLHAALAAETDDTRQADLLDTYFEAKVAARPPAPDLLRRAHAVLLDPEVTTVDVFAQALAISPRHLLRLCRRLFGFPPKLLLRRQRFMRTLEAVMAAPRVSRAPVTRSPAPFTAVTIRSEAPSSSWLRLWCEPVMAVRTRSALVTMASRWATSSSTRERIRISLSE